MIRKAASKIKERTGDSIAEVLVALLISALGLVMLASSINVSSNLVTKSRASMESYYSYENMLEEKAASDKTGKISVITEGNLPLTESLKEYSVRFYINNAAPKLPVISYGK